MGQTRDQIIKKYNKHFTGKLVKLYYYGENGYVHPIGIIENLFYRHDYYRHKLCICVRTFVLEDNRTLLFNVPIYNIYNSFKTGEKALKPPFLSLID